MKNQNVSVLRLPSPEAATPNRLARSFSKLCTGLIAAGIHAASLASALRSVADQLEARAVETVDGAAVLPPFSDPEHDIQARSFNVGHIADCPEIAALIIESISARKFTFVMQIRDLRLMGETLVKRAGDIARLAARKGC